jgi:hypothetical protein
VRPQLRHDDVKLGRGVRCTEDDHVRLEESSTTRHEFLDGEISAMAGARASHDKVAANAIAALVQRVRSRRRCQVFDGDQRIHVTSTSVGPAAKPTSAGSTRRAEESTRAGASAAAVGARLPGFAIGPSAVLGDLSICVAPRVAP